MKDRFYSHPLSASERPTKLYRYFVTGSGSFPVDMLRYDACWPANGEGAVKMTINAVERRHRSSIELLSYREPTVARWASFGWSVGQLSLDDPHLA